MGNLNILFNENMSLYVPKNAEPFCTAHSKLGHIIHFTYADSCFGILQVFIDTIVYVFVLLTQK